MGKLLQVAGFPCETTAIQLVEFLKKILPDEKIQNVWFDPYREPRAVAMFLHELDQETLYQLSQQEDIAFQDHILAFKTEKPTWSIFVRTYGSIDCGPIDKLRLMFQKKPSRMVQHIQPLDDDCYEITFSDGWDAVQEVCKKDWVLAGTKLTVCPYFECFKEPVIEIHEMISNAEVADQRFKKICTKPPVPINLTNPHLVTISNKPPIKLSENSVQETFSEATKDPNCTRSSDHNEKTIVFFKHQCIPILLRCLHFDKALDGYDCHLNIHEDNKELEFEITGPKMKVKKVARLLDQEFMKVKGFTTRNDFLALNKVLTDLQKRIDATGSFVLLTEMGNDINLVVADRYSNKVSFSGFVSSLVFEEQFSPLSVEDYQEHNKWIEQFNNDYKIGHVFVSDTNVTLMFLSHKKQKMNVIIELMKSKLKSHSVNKTEVKENNGEAEDCSTSDHQNLTEPSDNGTARKQENLSDMKSYSEDEKIINETYCFKHSFMLKLLHTLNLRSTVAEICPTLTLELDVLDLKVFISGQAKEVQAVKQCLKEEEEMISLTEDEEQFLEREKVQTQLPPLINKHKISFVHDSKDPTQLILVVKNEEGKIEKFQEFIKSHLVTKVCCTLPNREVYESVAWQTFQKSLYSQYNFCEIFVSNNLMVSLLSLAHQSEELEMIIPLIITNSSQHVSNDDKSTTSLNPADSQDLNDQEMRQECEEEESTLIKHTVVKKTKDKKRGPTLTLMCQNKFFVWLLDQLKFKEVVENLYPETSVRIDVDENEVVIRGDQAESIKSLVLELDGQISYNEDEETFLQNVKILQQIETTIKSDSMHLVLSENLECFVQYQDDHQVSLKHLASNFVAIKECFSLPSTSFQDMLQWKEIVESLHSRHPFHKISVEGTKVMILTLNDRDEMETNEIENDLNHFILNNDEKSIRKNIRQALALKKYSSCEKDQYDTTFYQNAGNSQQNDEYGKSHSKSKDSNFMDFLTFSQQKIQYCNMFLQEELHDIQETFKSTEITIQSDGIELKASSEHCGYELKQRMKSLFDRIINMTKDLKYPGLVSFFMSEDGLKLISQISTKYECFIEPPMDGNNQTNTGLEVLKAEDQRINYQVTLLGTAKCPGFKVHLVQGNIRDIKSDVKVDFCISSEAQECIFKTNKSSCDITIILPRWKAPENSEYQEHFNQLRNSLRSVICLVFDQVKYLKKTTVIYDTNAIHDKEFPFPLDVIAKIVTEQLFAAFTDSSDSSLDVDVYICEPKYESVFKAFTYFMKRMGVDFGVPDQVSWDQICETDTFKHPDYRKYKYGVEIVASSPEYLASKHLFCYPIQPSLEASSCPFYHEQKSSKGLLEHSLKELQKEMPDGLLIGDVHLVSCSPLGRDVLVYCIPEWGSGVYQALKVSMKTIFTESHKYDAVFITPPGLGFQKFPLPYLVQTFFHILDKIIAVENNFRLTKIYLVVHNTEYKMAFESELQKRYPKIAEKQTSWQRFTSFWDSADKKDHKGKGSSSCTDSSILVNKVLSLPIKYWGTCKENLNMAHCDIERELKRLMRDSTLTCTFDKKDTINFEKLSNQMGDIPVLITFEKHIMAKIKGQKSESKKNSGGKDKGRKEKKNTKTQAITSKLVMTGSHITIQGLSQIEVNNFRDLITIGKDNKLKSSSSLLSTDIDFPSVVEEQSSNSCGPPNSYISDSDISMEPGASQNSSSLTLEEVDGCHEKVNKKSQKKEMYAEGNSHRDKTAVSKKKSDHNADTSIFEITEENKGLNSNDATCQKSASASSHGCVGSFKWFYEASDKTSSGKAFITFKHFYESTNQMIEAAYSKDKKTKADIKGGKATLVDFSDMTVTWGGKKKGIIRVEELDASQQATKPGVWTVNEDEVWKAIKLDENSDPFKKIERELKEKIPVEIKKLNIKRIENINLFQRFKTKNSQLDGGCTLMWHKVSEDNVPLVCQFGFHPRFSTMPDENMGDGVLFKVNPWDCLEEKEIKDKKTVILFKSRLALGQTGPGGKRFRCVPQDTKRQPQDSVQVDDQAMIFSDAQAFPSHLITFTFV